MSELSEKIAAHVEYRFDEGKNHFLVRNLMADLALFLAQDRNEIIFDANERIVSLLRSKEAEAVVYTIRGDHGSGATDSPHFVLVTKRGGVDTQAKPRNLVAAAGDQYVTLASTAPINDQPDIL